MHRLLLAALIALALPTAAKAQSGAQDLLVFAAASLKNALDEVNAGWTQMGVKVSYAASSALARQIESGAPADLFLSADLDWMDYLDQKTQLKPSTRSILLGNRIVLIAPVESKASVKIAPGFDLAGLLGRDGRLAMADTNAVPAGKYGKAALEALNVWPNVSGRIAQAENVRAALLLVARGEAPAGIVYATDAAADAKNVRVLDTFPTNTHPPILYPVAQLAGSKHPQAAAWLAGLRGPAAKAVFEKHGFTVIPANAATN
jgi:molybdate transport system substrate-binding protein